MLRQEDGSSIGMICTCRDVTEKMRTEITLGRNEEKFRRIFDSIQDGYLLADFEGNIKQTNAMAARLLGYEQQEF